MRYGNIGRHGAQNKWEWTCGVGSPQFTPYADSKLFSSYYRRQFLYKLCVFADNKHMKIFVIFLILHIIFKHATVTPEFEKKLF